VASVPAEEHYESLVDTGETWWERLVTHEDNECYLYHSFLEQESDPRVKAIWNCIWRWNWNTCIWPVT
jgi:hypothetical protein